MVRDEVLLVHRASTQAGCFLHGFEQRLDRDLLAATDVVDFAVPAACHHRQQTGHQIVHVEERARLRAVTVDRRRLAIDQAGDHLRYDPLVVRRHARAIGVEDAYDANV